MRAFRPALVLTTVCAAAVLTGCSGGGGAPEATPDWTDSPLNTYLAAVWGGDLDPDQQAAQQADVEEAVAVCMADEGFEYVPQDTSTMFSASSTEDWKPDDREWVSQWGYGALDWPGRTDGQTEAVDDPNAEYVAALSESESTAYYEVLYGPQPTEEQLAEGDGSWSPTWEEQGCYGRATHEVHGDDPTQSSEHKPVMDAVNAFYQDVYENPDPAMAEVEEEWSDCMAGAGHSGFARQQDAQQSIYDAQSKLYENSDQAEGDPEGSPEYAALKEKEVALALDDLDCREKTDYRQRSLTVQWAAEEEFIADHKAELDALVADAEARRG